MTVGTEVRSSALLSAEAMDISPVPLGELMRLEVPSPTPLSWVCHVSSPISQWSGLAFFSEENLNRNKNKIEFTGKLTTLYNRGFLPDQECERKWERKDLEEVVLGTRSKRTLAVISWKGLGHCQIVTEGKKIIVAIVSAVSGLVTVMLIKSNKLEVRWLVSVGNSRCWQPRRWGCPKHSLITGIDCLHRWESTGKQKQCLNDGH